MHERTERAIARLLFVFCCAVPTAFTLLLIFVSWLPWYHHKQLREFTAQLSRDTGLIVQIEDFEKVSPSKWLLHHVRLVEPETGQEVASVRQVTWLSEDDYVGVLLHQPKLQSPQLDHAWNLVHDRFLCRPELTGLAMKFSANDLTIESETGSQTMTDVDAWIEPRANSVLATLQCLPAGRNGSPVNISVLRDRSSVPRTTWTLETGATPLPCSALAGNLPLMKRLGPDAEFVGTLQWEIKRDGEWSIDLGGSQFTNIDLSHLFEDLPHRFTGKADLSFARCSFVPNQSVNISGTLKARDGWVGRSLLRSLHDELNFAVDKDALEIQSGDVRYDLCSLNFELIDWELLLQGTCGMERGYSLPGIALCDHHRALAQSSDRPVPAVRLAHAVAPEHSELVPISRQTAGLMSLFMPPSRKPSVDADMIPSSRVRKASTWSGGEPVRQR